MIVLTDLAKAFGGRLAVAGLNLEVPSGSICGLLGHNGAGKSTVIGMILGQVLPDAGSIRINGYDVFADRLHALARLGAIYETPAFYDYLSGERNLRIYSEYTARTDATRLKEVVELVGLTDRIGDRVATYSHGMRQRLALAQALLPRPNLLILDEPTEGLDPEGIIETRDLILKLHREWEMTILLSSHQLSEMEQVCTHLAVMQEGRLMFSGDWRQRMERKQRVIIRVDRQAEAERGLSGAGLVTWADGTAGARLCPGVTMPAVTRWLVQAGYEVEEVAAKPMTLEDFYLETIRPADPGET
ncbi:MAG TPA: ABC transporter ATP-binding protein [Chthoniobacteraceae bacterium]|nr:ABC transporter ATP-binding protein [Chthoniobacteraceae bacterium]